MSGCDGVPGQSAKLGELCPSCQGSLNYWFPWKHVRLGRTHWQILTFLGWCMNLSAYGFRAICNDSRISREHRKYINSLAPPIFLKAVRIRVYAFNSHCQLIQTLCQSIQNIRISFVPGLHAALAIGKLPFLLHWLGKQKSRLLLQYGREQSWDLVLVTCMHAWVEAQSNMILVTPIELW